MKILIVSASDIEGGAARAAYRLHKALQASGIDSQMLVQSKLTDDYTVLYEENRLRRYFLKLRPVLDSLPVRRYKNRTQTFFSPAWLPFSNIVDQINRINPDVVHLHWVCNGMFRIEDIARIKTQIVWTLHDDWLFTGGCHIKWDCEKYIKSCGACPRLSSNKENDLSRKIWLRKQKIFQRKDMVINSLSRWLYECAKKSSLLKDKQHVNLPNLIDTTVFRSYDKQIAREFWRLPQDKKLILFGANYATSDINKGFKELVEALHKLQQQDVELVVFGSSKPKNPPDFGFKTHYTGYLHDDISLVTLYNAVDVMVTPSLQENLSNIIMESLSCGKPVVAFDVGGNSDLVEHKINGYLAKPYDTTDLKNGIEWILMYDKYEALCLNAREKIMKYFNETIVTSQYISLYNDILKQRS